MEPTEKEEVVHLYVDGVPLKLLCPYSPREAMLAWWTAFIMQNQFERLLLVKTKYCPPFFECNAS